MDNLLQLEQQVYQYLRENNKAAAVNILYDLIIRYAQGRDFKKAESLRERIIQINPLALMEINASAEFIDQEKLKAIGPDYLERWADLYSILTIKEGIALYFAMKESVFHGEQPIFAQGDRNSNLYFINQGQLRMLYSKAGREVFLKMLRPGDIVGADSFFSDSVSTTTVTSFSRASLGILEKDILAKWQDQFPDLESKLRTYCLKLEKPTDLLNKKGLDRRTEKRFKINGKVIIQLLSVLGVPAGKPFLADLEDISASGLSCVSALHRKENVRLFLGWNLNLKLLIEVHGKTRTMDQTGTVVAVLSEPSRDHSLHIKFNEKLEKPLMREIESGTPRSSWRS